jgi:hypothetical protein
LFCSEAGVYVSEVVDADAAAVAAGDGAGLVLARQEFLLVDQFAEGRAEGFAAGRVGHGLADVVRGDDADPLGDVEGDAGDALDQVGVLDGLGDSGGGWRKSLTPRGIRRTSRRGRERKEIVERQAGTLRK